MSAKKPTGIRARHVRTCGSTRGARCNCQPGYEASVFLKREGKKIRKTFASQAEAKAWRADAIVAARHGKLRTPDGTTVAEAAKALLAGMGDGSIPTRKGGRYRPSTIRSYDEALRLRILPALGRVRLSELRREDVQNLADALTAAGLSAATVTNKLDPLRVICRRALRRDLIALDPTEGLELRRPEGGRERVASPAEATALLDALPDEERAIWATAMYAGLRRGELRALHVCDIDRPKGHVVISRGWDDREGEQEGKTAAARRSVPILDSLAPILAAHLLRTGRSGDDLVFGRTASEPFSPSTVRKRALAAWKAENARREAEAENGERVELLVPIALHEARHTYASLLIASGANPKALSVILGHASISTTFDVYGHLLPAGLDEVALAANAFLARQGGERPTLTAVGS
jgi:integrase